MSFVFLAFLLLIIIGLMKLKLFHQNHQAASDTVGSDKRLEVQYKLRKEKNIAGNWALFLGAALIMTIIVFVFGKEYRVTKTNQREKIEKNNIPEEEDLPIE